MENPRRVLLADALPVLVTARFFRKKNLRKTLHFEAMRKAQLGV
jgi:hypothetical protein